MKTCYVTVQVALPAQGVIRNSLPLQYVLRSKCETLVNIQATLDSSESFMFSGYKEVH